MTHNLNVPALLGSLLVTALANAQTILAPRPVPLPARKIVTHDIGDFWPGTFVLHTNGTVTALGNAWLGGGVHSLPLTGIADMARLDALTPGASESVAMVGTSGLSMVRCNATNGTAPSLALGGGGGVESRGPWGRQPRGVSRREFFSPRRQVPGMDRHLFTATGDSK